MAFRHGVYKSEVPTGIIAPVQGEAGLPVVVGTAPVFQVDAANVNKPVLCYSYAEAVQAFGYSSDWDNYTLCEFIYSQFVLYGMSPVVMINVFDPATHKEAGAFKAYTITDGKINLGDKAMLPLSFKDNANYVADKDYVTSYDDDGNLILSVVSDGAMKNLASVEISFNKAKPESVTAAQIIGGIDAATGKSKGLELVNNVFPKFRLVPGLLCSPKWSENAEVAAIMRAKADNINGIFTGQAVIDIPAGSSGAPVYTAVPEWKNKNNYMAERQIVCWPKIKLGEKIYHLSTQLVGLMNKTDKAHADVPYKSPSNELLQMTSCVNDAGDEIELGLEQANYLNSQGIVTALNFMSGWVAWGNRTGAYPANSDPKDAFIPVRRMFDFIGNTFIQTFWQKTDEPMTPRLIRTIIDSFNLYLNGLTAREMLLGGRIEFLESENVLTDLMDGKLKFHVFITPPPPAEMIEGILEFDPDYFSTLFEAMS